MSRAAIRHATQIWWVNFDAEDFDRKRPHNKRYLQSFARLPVDVDVPLVGIVSGWRRKRDLIWLCPLCETCWRGGTCNWSLWARVSPIWSTPFWQLDQDFGDKASAFLQFDGALAQQIYAGL